MPDEFLSWDHCRFLSVFTGNESITTVSLSRIFGGICPGKCRIMVSFAANYSKFSPSGLCTYFPIADLSQGINLEFSRVFYSLGLIMAGYISDRSRKYGALSCLTALVFPFAMIALSNELQHRFMDHRICFFWFSCCISCGGLYRYCLCKRRILIYRCIWLNVWQNFLRNYFKNMKFLLVKQKFSNY